MRGLCESDCRRCWLALDDMASAQGKHFPCIIHLRDGVNPIGMVGDDTRQERALWSKHHNAWEDPICRKNCLDVCIDYNNRANERVGK